MRNRLMIMIWIAALLALALPVASVSAQPGDGFMNFTDASSTCASGSFTFEVSEVVPLVARMQQGPTYTAYVEATDSASNFLGSAMFTVGIGDVQNGSIIYAQEPVGDVTFWLYYSFLNGIDIQPELFFRQMDTAATPLQQFDGILADTITVTPVCDGVAAPGCDTKIPIPDQSVVGSFLSDADAYWAPGKPTENPLVTIGEGNTAWVLGQDDTGQYYKIVWVCQYLWVQKSTMGPNFDAVWNGTPLPTTVVD